jgi:ubiquinone biosynthesis protein
MFFGQTLKNIKRSREVISVLLKYGFEDVVAHSWLRKLVPKRTRSAWQQDGKPVLEYTRYERIRLVAEELGATFIKAAQVLSNRPDLLPEALIRQLEKMQSDVPPFDSETAKQIIEAETGKKISELFDYFKDETIGSASIGQVHRAKLKDGPEVVVKVQRPGVQELIDTDLSIVKDIVRRADKYLERNGLNNVMAIVEAFEKTMHRELDYTSEARNIEQFREFYKSATNFYVPPAFREYSTSKVLITEYVEGCKITDTRRMEKWGLDPKKIAETGMDIYLTQIFEFGYFHADPHPGNIIIKKDGTICLIDFGMVGKLMRKDKISFAGIFVGIAREDPHNVARNLLKLALDSEIKDVRALETDIMELIEDYGHLDVSESSMAEMVFRLQEIIYEYRLSVPGAVFLILRALAILEGIGKVVHPTFNTFEFLKPYGAKIIKEKFSAHNLQVELTDRSTDLMELLDSFPVEAKDILKKVRKGKLTIQLDHTGTERYIKKFTQATNRLSLSFIIVGLLIGSSIIMTADLGPEQMDKSGIPSLSLIGFVSALVLALLLFLANIRSGK